MTEQKVKKRAWVKNAVIIFLAIMLVLTFFSNTIMNHSLPEVATTYVSSGTITAKIRGNGKVEALETYEVKLSQTRTVESVLAKNGDLIEVGDVLFMLSGEESQEMESALKNLEDLEYQYKTKLLNITELDYAYEDLELQYKKEDLAKAVEERDEAIVSKVELEAAQKAVDTAKKNVSSYQDEIEQINEDISELGTVADNTARLDELRSKIYEKQEEISKAEADLNSAISTNASYIRMLEDYTENHLLRDYIRTEVLIKPYKNNNSTYVVDPITNTYNDWLMYLRYLGEGSVPERMKDWKIDVPDVDALELIIDGEVTAEIDSWSGSTLASRISQYIGEQATILSASAPGSTEKRMSDAYQEVQNARNKVTTLESDLELLYAQFSTLLSDKDYEKYEALSDKLKNRKKLLTAAQEEQAAAEAKLAELKTDEAAWDAANDKVKQLQRDLEKTLMTLAETKKSDEIKEALNDLEMSRLKKQLIEAEMKVAELKSEAVDKAVTAPVSGKITSLNVSAGDSIYPDSTLLTIELIDRGYQLEFSITNEQAKKVRIGDMATVSNYYWGPDITAQLIAIKNDPEAPREKKLLTFSLQGEIETGSQLSLELGGRGSDYEFIVPNSAIRTDNDGDFVLIIEQKSTPLGTRYMATRVSVNVIEKDDNNSAVSGGLVSWDYVITSSNKPVEAGAYVRLAEGQSR